MHTLPNYAGINGTGYSAQSCSRIEVECHATMRCYLLAYEREADLVVIPEMGQSPIARIVRAWVTFLVRYLSRKLWHYLQDHWTKFAQLVPKAICR